MDKRRFVYDPKITVCGRCFQARCFQGVHRCDYAYIAGTVEQHISTLIKRNEEHPDYWNNELILDNKPPLTSEILESLGAKGDQLYLSKGGDTAPRKYQLLRLHGLRGLLEDNPGLCSPDGNRMIVARSLMGQYFYDHKERKLYGLCLKEVPTTDNDDKWLTSEYAMDLIKYHMSYLEAIDFLKSKGKWVDPTPLTKATKPEEE